MRDRLIELLCSAPLGIKTLAQKYSKIIITKIADYLLTKGVIVPPCKVGDIVYAIGENKIVECVCHEITLHNKLMIATTFKCDYDCKGCPFWSWSQDYCDEYSCQGEYGDWFFSVDDFGKIVFLTREEAEQALNGGAE